MSSLMKWSYNVCSDDFTRAGEASSDVKKKLRQMGVSPDVIRKVAIAMYEGEINMVIHANGGEITLEIEAADKLHGIIAAPDGYKFKGGETEKALTTGKYIMVKQ